MNPVEFFEATVVDRDTDLAAKLVMVPARAVPLREFSPYYVGDTAVVQRFGGGRMGTFLPQFLAATFMPRDYYRSDPLGPLTIRDWLEWGERWRSDAGDRGERVLQFAAYLSYAELLPIQSSPLEAKAMASVVQAASAPGLGGAFGYLVAGDSAIGYLAVPVGIVLAGPLVGLARGLEQGIYERVLEYIRGGRGREKAEVRE